MSKANRNDMIIDLENFLVSAGLNVESEGLQDTPKRFTDYLLEFMQPFDAAKVLGTEFTLPNGFHSLVAQSDIPFRMVCEHHLLPALGKAAIGYVPHKKVVGLSKLTRLVQAVGTEKPGLQETICDRIADLLDEHLDPKGVIVIIKAEHSCMACRGINSPGVLTSSSAVRGVFRDVPAARVEFFNLIKF